MSIVLVAFVDPKPDHRDEVIRAFEETIARVHAEDSGCELYALHGAGERLVMIEKWASAEELDAHGRGAPLADLRLALKGKLANRMEVLTLTPRPAGTPDQGVL